MTRSGSGACRAILRSDVILARPIIGRAVLMSGDILVTVDCYECFRPAVVSLDWTDDGVELCLECLVPSLAGLEETLRDMFVGRPNITIRTVASLPVCECPDHGPDGGDGECFCTPECIRGDAIAH